MKVNYENSRIRIRVSRSGSGTTPKCHGSETLESTIVLYKNSSGWVCSANAIYRHNHPTTRQLQRHIVGLTSKQINNLRQASRSVLKGHFLFFPFIFYHFSDLLSARPWTVYGEGGDKLQKAFPRLKSSPCSIEVKLTLWYTFLRSG